MKVFKRDGKINFIDENNVYVGYDIRDHCCELSDWIVSEKDEIKDEIEDISADYEHYDLQDYVFNKKYFKEYCIEAHDDSHETNFATFKMSNSKSEVLYLHLYNHQSGHYWHGFEACIDGKDWRYGNI